MCRSHLWYYVLLHSGHRTSPVSMIACKYISSPSGSSTEPGFIAVGCSTTTIHFWCAGWLLNHQTSSYKSKLLLGTTAFSANKVLKTLLTADEPTQHLTLAAYNQLAQSILKIGSVPAENVG